MHTYTPAYYSSFQETVTTLCKSILLPFSHKNRRLAADQKLSKKQSDHLKWQQESFHKILNLIELLKEGIVPQSEVDSFKSHLLDTLIASPSEKEAIGVIKDKLLFLKELHYAKCVSADEYHSSKRPLLQRLAVEGVEIDCKDVIIGDTTKGAREKENEEEWSNIDLKDKEVTEIQTEKSKTHRTPIKSLMKWKGKEKKESNKKATNNENSSSILVPEVTPKLKRKPFRSLFDKESKEEDSTSTNKSKHVKKQWGLDGFVKWKRSNIEEAEYTSLVDCSLVASPTGEGPDTKGITKKIHSNGSSSDFFAGKVFDSNTKKLSSTHPNLNSSYGDIVSDVVKEFKGNAREKSSFSNDDKWVAFDDNNEENYHPDLFFKDGPCLYGGTNSEKEGKDCFLNNPFVDEQNPFFVSRN